jgi:hypothetical protein
MVDFSASVLQNSPSSSQLQVAHRVEFCRSRPAKSCKILRNPAKLQGQARARRPRTIAGPATCRLVCSPLASFTRHPSAAHWPLHSWICDLPRRSVPHAKSRPRIDAHLSSIRPSPKNIQAPSKEIPPTRAVRCQRILPTKHGRCIQRPARRPKSVCLVIRVHEGASARRPMARQLELTPQHGSNCMPSTDRGPGEGLHIVLS